MDALDVIVRQTERSLAELFRSARALPEGCLDWRPAPDVDTALEQLQDVATAFAMAGGRLGREGWATSGVIGERWRQDRARFRDLDDLERIARESYGGFVQQIRQLDPRSLAEPMEDDPDGLTCFDLVAGYARRMVYHQGQIDYIAAMANADGAAA